MRENDGPITSISRLVFFCQFASVSTVSCKLFFVVSSRHGSLVRLKKRSFFMCFDFFVELYVDVLFVEV